MTIFLHMGLNAKISMAYNRLHVSFPNKGIFYSNK